MPAFIGFVRYADDGLYFRQVMPEPGEGDAVLDDSRWIEEGCDPNRVAVMDKFAADQPETWPKLTGEA